MVLVYNNILFNIYNIIKPKSNIKILMMVVYLYKDDIKIWLYYINILYIILKEKDKLFQ